MAEWVRVYFHRPFTQHRQASCFIYIYDLDDEVDAGSRTLVQTGTDMVSTCLSFCWLSGSGWQEAADLNLIPLRVRHGPGKGLQTILAWMVPHIQ